MPAQAKDNVVRLDVFQSSTECATYAFEGAVIRLTAKDYERWRRAYHAIPDFDAELCSLDDYYASLPPAERGKWFIRCSGALRNRHNRYAAARRERDEREASGIMAAAARASNGS